MRDHGDVVVLQPLDLAGARALALGLLQRCAKLHHLAAELGARALVDQRVLDRDTYLAPHGGEQPPLAGVELVPWRRVQEHYAAHPVVGDERHDDVRVAAALAAARVTRVGAGVRGAHQLARRRNETTQTLADLHALLVLDEVGRQPAVRDQTQLAELLVQQEDAARGRQSADVKHRVQRALEDAVELERARHRDRHGVQNLELDVSLEELVLDASLASRRTRADCPEPGFP